MKIVYVYTVLLFGILFLFSCAGKTSSNETTRSEVKLYFDVKAFFEQEIIRLSQSSNFKKSASINGKEEEISFHKIDLENELKIFSNSDINRPAWSDKYSADSTFLDRKLKRLTYKTEDDKLRTRNLTIDFKEEEVSKIYIENSTNTSVAKTFQFLTYEPLIGYSIESRQEVVMMEEGIFRIKVSFQ